MYATDFKEVSNIHFAKAAMLSPSTELRVMAYIIQSSHRLYLLLAALLKLVAGRVQDFNTVSRHSAGTG
jgi:hypothetical protein